MPRPRNTLNPRTRPEHVAVGELVRTARRRAGYSQQRLAQALAVTASAIAQWELGLRPMPRDRFHEIAVVLGDERLLAAEGAPASLSHLEDISFLLAASAYQRSRSLFSWYVRQVTQSTARDQLSASRLLSVWTALCRILAATDAPGEHHAAPDTNVARRRAARWLPLLLNPPPNPPRPARRVSRRPEEREGVKADY